MKDNKTSTHCEPLTSATGARFDGFFAAGNHRSYGKDKLLDARARRIFDMTEQACQAGVYPYQVALQSKSGPWVRIEGRDMLSLSAYDYLGLIGDPRIDEAAKDAISKYGTGVASARMLTGTLDLHHQMEDEMAAFKGMDEAVSFSSGYLANLGVVSALLGPQDRVILDAFSHRSLVDACRLAGVQIQRFRHNDPVSLRQELENGAPANRTLIIADGIFSMEGDICRLPELIAIKKEFGCYLMIDDAHATGVLGTYGRGTDEHFGVPADEVDIWTGSVGKSIPASGGFACVSQEISIYLQHAAGPFVFSGALCPMSAAVIRTAVAIMLQEPERVARVKSNGDFLRKGLRDLEYDLGASETPIIPVILRDEATAAYFASHLRDRGILVAPVMFPAVPQGSARLRLCATAAHTLEDLQLALDAFRELR
jgi:glycine C-acetyltransferase